MSKRPDLITEEEVSISKEKIFRLAWMGKARGHTILRTNCDEFTEIIVLKQYPI